MIMKANKQIGFIYKDEESIDKILKDGEVVFEKGFLREKTSATLPINFGGVGKDLKDYKIYGNTKQQLLPDGYTQVDYIGSSGTQYIDTGYYGNLNTEIRVTASNSGNNTQLFGDITTSNSAISCNFSFTTLVGSRFGNKNVSAILGNYITTDVTFELIENKNGIYINNNEVITFNTTDNFTTTKTLILLNRNSSSGTTTNGWGGKLYYVKIYDNNMLVRDFIPCYRNSDNEVGLYDLVNNVFYTNQGTGVFTYGNVAPTPDAPIEMVSCGDLITDSQDENYGKYKIPVNVRSDNLCDGINQKYWLSVTVLSAGMADGNSGLAIELKENTNYTISTQIIQERYRVALINTLPTSGTGIPCYNGVKKDGTKDNITISSSQYKYLILNATDLTKCQIVEGSTAPSKYIPYYNQTTNIYLDEPLRKIDEYSDYIDFINGKIVRQLGETVLDGSENWEERNNVSYSNTILRYFYNLSNVDYISRSGASLIKSNYFEGVHLRTRDKNGIARQLDSSGINIFISNTIVSNLSAFKTWLSSHNVIADYLLSAPIEETITLPNIPTVDENNTLNIETEITPSQVYIKYKSNT